MAEVRGTWRSERIDAQDGVTDGVDYIYGRGGHDLIFGLGGNDTIIGGTGADTIDGGSGIDNAAYYDSAASVMVSLANGSGSGGEAQGDTLVNIENLYGSVYDDSLAGDDGDNFLDGYIGNDIVKGGGGADLIDGGEGDDTLKGGGGADNLYGGTGFDSMSGGAGDDIYIIDWGDSGDSVGEAAGEGNDTVYSYAYSYALTDNVEILSLMNGAVFGIGNAQHNTIFGNEFDNALIGGGANDILSGLGGNDTFVFGAGDAHGDVVYEFDGNGAGAGDVLEFVGYGPGATFTQASATEWFITSGDGTIQEVITLIGGPSVHVSDYLFT